MPTLPAQTLLEMAEGSGRLACVDTESSGLNGDYNSLLVLSVKPFGKKPVSFTVDKPGADKKLLQEAIPYLRQFSIVVAFFGLYHDIPLIATRLLKHELPPWKPDYELDPWLVAKRRLKLSRRSQSHILSWLELPEQKLTLSAEDWNRFLADWPANKAKAVARCESDVRGLEALYKRIKTVIPDTPRRRIV